MTRRRLTVNGGSWNDAFKNGLRGAAVGAIMGGISAGVAYGVAEATSSIMGVNSATAHASSFFNGTGGYTTATFKALAHGVSRAAMARAQGQSTRGAFISAFISSGFSAPRRWGFFGGTMATAVSAGTVSELTGGKFANGAISGTFIHMFNAWGGFRKLGGKISFGQRGSMADKDNLMLAHEGFIFDDGTIIGYFGDSMVRVDYGHSASEYSQLKYYDDNILQQAIGETNIGQYDLIHNNCQDWASRVDSNYHKLGGQ